MRLTRMKRRIEPKSVYRGEEMVLRGLYGGSAITACPATVATNLPQAYNWYIQRKNCKPVAVC